MTLRLPLQLLLHRDVREGTTLFPGLLHITLDPYFIMLSVKQGDIKYDFLSIWYDWTPVSQTIGEHSTHQANGKVLSITLGKWLNSYIKPVKGTLASTMNSGQRQPGCNGSELGSPYFLMSKNWSLTIICSLISNQGYQRRSWKGQTLHMKKIWNSNCRYNKNYLFWVLLSIAIFLEYFCVSLRSIYKKLKLIYSGSFPLFSYENETIDS